jgi:hypothetical protein
MTEPEGGQLPQENAAAAPTEPVAPQEFQAPQAEPGYTLPEKFAGKTVEEVAASYMELERKLGEQSQEISALRDMAQRQPTPPLPYYTGQPNAYGAPPPGYGPPPPGYYPQAPVAPAAPPPPKMDWDNPVDTFREVARREFAPVFTNYQQQTAKSVGEVIYNAAKTERPDLFVGIEPNVKAFVNTMIDQGVLKPESALSPQTWQMAAWQLQGMRTGYKPGQPAPAINPVAPVRTEMPGSRPPSTMAPAYPMSEADRRMTERMGITDEMARQTGRK